MPTASIISFHKYLNEYIKNVNASRLLEHNAIVSRSLPFKSIINSIENNNIDDAISAINMLDLSTRLSDYFPCSVLKKHPKEIQPVTAKFVSDKIKNLTNLFQDFDIQSYFGYNEYLNWSARIIMKHMDPQRNFGFEYDFGVFQFFFRIKHDGKPEVITKPLKDNKILDTGSYHPHIRVDGKTCIGTYEKDIKTDIQNLNIFDIMQNITLLLEQYNPTSIYSEDIHAWIGQKCPVCSGFISESDESARCAKTMQVMHKNCAGEISGKFYNPLLIKQCMSCDVETVDWVFINNSITCKDCI